MEKPPVMERGEKRAGLFQAKVKGAGRASRGLCCFYSSAVAFERPAFQRRGWRAPSEHPRNCIVIGSAHLSASARTFSG